MQVKKFEAKTMKEALEMVKVSLGPEAIILSAKDNKAGFGLGGHQSVSVTAAVTEEMMRKKKAAEQRLNIGDKEKYSRSTANRQKEFINKVAEQVKQRQEIKSRTFTTTPYIDINDSAEANSFSEDEEAASPRAPESSPSSYTRAASTRSGSVLSEEPRLSAPSGGGGLEMHAEDQAEGRIREAAKRAREGAKDLFENPQPPARKPASRARMDGGERVSDEIVSLRREIKRLRGLVKDFQPMPQTFVNMHPGAEEGIGYEMSGVYEKLLREGLDKDFLVEGLKLAKEKLPADKVKSKAFVNAWLAQHIMNNIRVAENRTDNKYHVFVGPSGHGKTSALVKLASHMVIREKKSIAIVTTESQKVGAVEQLKIYAQILNVPFAVIRKKSDWQELEKKLAKVDSILVDFPGLNLRSISETDFIRSVLPPKTGGRSIHYVQSVLARDETALEIAGRYQMIHFDDVIFTNLDETSHHGLIFNFQNKLDVPLHSFGIGPNVPEDFEPATRERVIDLIFKMTKFKKNEGKNE